MRSLFIGIFAVALAAAPAAAQQFARVTVSAQLAIPQVLTLRSGAVTETTANGTRTRSTTLYVTANRNWVLSVFRNCQSTCGRLQARIVNSDRVTTADFPAGTTSILQGRSGSSIPVTIELTSDASLPPPSELEYLITAA